MKAKRKAALEPHVIAECEAHGKLAAMMQFHHSDEMRLWINWAWEGFIKDFGFDLDPDERLEKKIFAVKDRVAKMHRTSRKGSR